MLIKLAAQRPWEVLMDFGERMRPEHADDLENAPLRCGSPILSGPHGEVYTPCNRCLFCRAKSAAILAHRIDLEAREHSQVAFVTLTYSPEYLPADGSVSLDHMTRFLKRHRHNVGKFRYYYLAEYGSIGHRPHYHVVLYGYPSCARSGDGTRQAEDGRTPICCDHCRQLAQSWGMGRVDSRPFEAGGSNYLAGYAVKALTGLAPPRGVAREFAKWSRMPGLGYGSVAEICKATLEEDMFPADAPVALRYGERVRPLGDYLRTKVREALGITEVQVAASRARMLARQVELNRAARSHGTTAAEMGARLLEQFVQRRSSTHAL